MPPPPDRELLTQSAARQLLQRAGQIDSDSTSVDTLRAAAHEAGISDAAFDAALAEMRGTLARQAILQPRRSRSRLAMSLVAAVFLLAAGVFVVIPRAVGSAQSDMDNHEFLVECLPMSVAQDIAQSMLVDPGNEVELSPGSRILRVRATGAQWSALQAAFAAAAKAQTSCDNTPAGR